MSDDEARAFLASLDKLSEEEVYVRLISGEIQGVKNRRELAAEWLRRKRQGREDFQSCQMRRSARMNNITAAISSAAATISAASALIVLISR